MYFEYNTVGEYTIMRKIRIENVRAYANHADFVIMDMTDCDPGDAGATGKKRGTFTVDYTHSDIMELKGRGLDLAGALEYYREHIYELVRYYILSEWENAGGLEEAMELIEGYIRPHFEE